MKRKAAASVGAAGLRLRGGRPLKQAAFRDELAVERAGDGVAHQVRLVREEREQERHLRGVRPRVAPHAPEVARPGDAARVQQQARRQVRVDGESQREQDEERPQQGRTRQQRPSEGEPEQDARRDEAAPQVVENLPARDERKPVTHAAPPRVGDDREQPARDLPVAARPAVLAHRISHVACRVVVQKFHVRHERGPRVESLEQVVTEQRVLRHAVGERSGEGVHVVQALARERAFAEQVLINVGRGGRVRVNAGVA
jgi:hypothetical protein